MSTVTEHPRPTITRAEMERQQIAWYRNEGVVLQKRLAKEFIEAVGGAVASNVKELDPITPELRRLLHDLIDKETAAWKKKAALHLYTDSSIFQANLSILQNTIAVKYSNGILDMCLGTLDVLMHCETMPIYKYGFADWVKRKERWEQAQ